MKQRKSYDFSAIGASIDRQMSARKSFEPTASEAVQRAAVQASFPMDDLRATEQENDYLGANAQRRDNGRYELRDAARNTVLIALQQSGKLSELYNRYALPEEEIDSLQRAFGKVLRREKIDLGKASVAELNALFRIRFWVDGMGYEMPDGGTLRGALNRRAMEDKFRRQTANFKGRSSELRALDNYVSSVSSIGEDMMSRPPLLVYGVGGIGKSTLISRFLLDRTTKADGPELPFVYLDFDHPGLSISDPLALFAAGLRQLVAQFPAVTGNYSELEYALSDIQASISIRRDAVGKGFKKGTSGRTWQRMLDDHSRRHLDTAIRKGWSPDRPILIVLDSFEEAQYRTGETEIRNFLEFLNELNGRLPNLRLLIVGRSDLVVSPFTFAKLEIGDFDEAAALGYLEGVGVPDAELRQLIFSQVGGNPLTLKLAAALAEKYDYGKKITPSGFKQMLAGTQVRELLVKRNIEHIRDPEVRKLALPGMLLRRIDADVIRHVLAPVCGLGEIDEAKSRKLYTGLQRVTFLIEQRNGEIHFRRDLRMALREEIWREQQERCLALHREASAYYRDKNQPQDKAEHYYHTFQLNGKPWVGSDNVDWAKYRPFLEDALLELPPTAAAYLARQFKVRLPQEIMERAGLQENDFAMVRRMEEVSLEGVGGVDQMKEVWKEVADRTESNELFFIYYRQVLALRLGHFDRMLDDLSPRSKATLEEMRVYLNLLRNNYQGDYEQALLDLTSAFTTFPPSQLLETVVLALKSLALSGKPYNEELVLSFTICAGEIRKDDATDEDVREQNWRPYTRRLWDVRNTFNPLEREQFTGLCRSIYTSFSALKEDYNYVVSELRDVDLERFSLVLQNETGKLVEDIAPSGASEIVAHDYLDFLIAFYKGEYDKIISFVDRVSVEAESAPPPPSPSAEPAGQARDEQLKNVIWRAKKFMEKGEVKLAASQLLSWANTHHQERYIMELRLLDRALVKYLNDRRGSLLTQDELANQKAALSTKLLGIIESLSSELPYKG